MQTVSPSSVPLYRIDATGITEVSRISHLQPDPDARRGRNGPHPQRLNADARQELGRLLSGIDALEEARTLNSKIQTLLADSNLLP